MINRWWYSIKSLNETEGKTVDNDNDDNNDNENENAYILFITVIYSSEEGSVRVF